MGSVYIIRLPLAAAIRTLSVKGVYTGLSVLKEGQIVTGKVTGIKNFGAFVDLDEGKNGLVHISQVADEYVKDINDFLEVGQEVKALVDRIEDDGKISLSIKKAQPKEKRAPKHPRPQASSKFNRPKRQSTNDFDAMMSNFLKESDDRLASIRKNSDNRLGGRR